MKIKTALTTLVLVLAPGLVAAQCMGHGHSATETAMSCAEGTIMDAETGTCVPIVSG